MTTLRSMLTIVLAPGLLSAGCALTSKGEPLRPRYFDPDVARAESRAPERWGSGLALQLGRIDSSSYLREPIAFRDSEQELGYYDTMRWSEKPEEYLRRQLARSLFEQHGFVRTVAGDVPVLEAELLEFSEDRARHSARLRVAILLHDERAGLLEQTITVERAIAASADGADDAPAMVHALADALHAAVEQISEQVGRALRAAPGVASVPAPGNAAGGVAAASPNGG